MKKSTSATNRPYYEIVRDTIADNIAKGNLPIGTRLLISAVADRLGVSRPPVRRALELLAEEGIVEALSSQGYGVGKSGGKEGPSRTNLHLLPLDLPSELSTNLGQASWERIFEAVENDVMNCIPFGTFQISETLIGDHFDVSRTVVRDVLSRLDARGLIEKDRSLHWIAGPFSARMLDDAHEMRRLLEPGALASSLPLVAPAIISRGRSTIEAALRTPGSLSTEIIGRIEKDLHVECLASLRNKRLAQAVRLSQISLVINRLFGTYIGLHDESDLLREHALVFDHMLLGDAEGASSAMLYHLDMDHIRSRDRLKVLSVFDAAEIAPYLIRIH
jgi:DNA-binding GntR family transcriptional regulator